MSKCHLQNNTTSPSLVEVIASKFWAVTSSSLSVSSPVALLLINQSKTFGSSVISPKLNKKIAEIAQIDKFVKI